MVMLAWLRQFAPLRWLFAAAALVAVWYADRERAKSRAADRAKADLQAADRARAQGVRKRVDEAYRKADDGGDATDWLRNRFGDGKRDGGGVR